MTSTHTLCCTHRPAVLLLMAMAVFFTSTPVKAAEPEVVRSAFLLGFSFGNGYNVYSQNPDLAGEAGTIFNSWMADVSEYAQRLNLTVDTVPVPVDPLGTDVLTSIVKAGRQKIDLMTIRITRPHGEQPAAALKLGYSTAIAIEYVPYLSPQVQRQTVADYNSLAAKMVLPESIIDNYTNTLLTTTDRQTTVAAMFEFKEAVASHYEGLKVATTEGARNQLYVWLMGWKLGLATLGQTRGADASIVDSMFEESRAFGEALGIRLPTLPEASTDSARDTAQAIHYLLDGAGEFVDPQLDSRYGPRASALFELAVKSTLAMILYGPDDDMGQTLRNVIDRSGRTGGLPANVYQPLVNKMSARAPYEEVKQAIINLNDQVVAHYSSDQPVHTQRRRLQPPRALTPTEEFTSHTDPNGWFRMTVPQNWRIEQQEGWGDESSNTFFRTTMFSPQNAYLADIDSYLSEGILVIFRYPPQDKVWSMTGLEWATSHIEEIIESNPGFVLTSSSSLMLGGQPALEYQMVGENSMIPEPEKSFFIIVANEQYRLILNIVSPTSKLGFFNNLRKILIENFEFL